MPEAREYYVITAADLTEKQLFHIEKALRVLKVPYEKELVKVPATNWNPTTGKFDL